MLSGTVNVSKVACPSAGINLMDAACPIGTGGQVKVIFTRSPWPMIGGLSSVHNGRPDAMHTCLAANLVSTEVEFMV
jgi:hypothetical protein